MKIAIYNTITGEILRHCECPERAAPLQASNVNEDWVECDEWEGFYVIDGDVVPKPAMLVSIDKTSILADGIDVSTITNIPTQTTANVDGTTVIINDGTLEITFDYPGSYIVTLEKFPYLPYEVTINAT